MENPAISDDLTLAIYRLVFGYIVALASLLAVSEIAAFLLGMPGLGHPLVHPMAALYLIWASFGIWRSF